MTLDLNCQIFVVVGVVVVKSLSSTGQNSLRRLVNVSWRRLNQSSEPHWINPPLFLLFFNYFFYTEISVLLNFEEKEV